MIWIRASVLAALIVVAAAQFPKPFIPILSQDYQISPDNRAYSFNYASADGSQRQESGIQKNSGTPLEAYSVTGSYAFSLPNGQPVQVNYVADEFGYQPTGPGVHPDIVRAVQAQVAEARANPQPPLGFDNSGFGRFG